MRSAWTLPPHQWGQKREHWVHGRLAEGQGTTPGNPLPLKLGMPLPHLLCIPPALAAIF